jgi:hypothetical protein
VGYPFQNKQVKSCAEILARDVDKEEKIGVVVIMSALFGTESHVATTGVAPS